MKVLGFITIWIGGLICGASIGSAYSDKIPLSVDYVECGGDS